MEYAITTNSNNNYNNNSNSNSNVTTIPSAVELSKCEVLTFYLWIDQDFNFEPNNNITYYPKCVFWDTIAQNWSDRGCYVLEKNIAENYVVCSCNHATFFGGTVEEFIPSINYITLKDFREITLKNVLEIFHRLILNSINIATFQRFHNIVLKCLKICFH